MAKKHEREPSDIEISTGEYRRVEHRSHAGKPVNGEWVHKRHFESYWKGHVPGLKKALGLDPKKTYFYHEDLGVCPQASGTWKKDGNLYTKVWKGGKMVTVSIDACWKL